LPGNPQLDVLRETIINEKRRQFPYELFGNKRSELKPKEDGGEVEHGREVEV
jgi:hypothetical protein